MILKIEFENFYSIKEPIRIDFRAANIHTKLSKELSQNIIWWKKTPILKVIGLFGPNASGKSNILKAITFCCRLILDSHLYNEGTVFTYEPFKFEDQEKPSRFLIDFVCEDIEYEYSFSLTRDRIIEESLYYYPSGRRAKIFVRHSDGEYSFGAGIISKPKDVAFNTGRKNLFLSRASSMNREIAQKIYRYFLNQFLLGLVNINDMTILHHFTKYKSVILKALEICDIDIKDIEVRKEQIPAPVLPFEGQTELSYKLVDVLRFKTIHHNNPDILFDMDLEESNGTKKLFQILLRLLDVVRNKKSILMDEFDTGLHIRLADFIIDLIHASESSQLLFTSHNINLIDIKRLRRDQIMFVNKSEAGTTEIYSLYDFKDFRENMDAQKGYIQGRFDAVPYIDSSVENIKQLLNG